MNVFSEYRAVHMNKYRWLSDDLFARWIVNKVSPYGKSILDVGCGDGFMLRYYGETFDSISAIEPSVYLYQNLLENPEFRNVAIKNASAENIPFDDLSFDVVIAKSSLHHFHNAQLGLREMNRVAKKVVAIIEVITPSLNTLEFISGILPVKEKGRDSSTIYTQYSLQQELQKVFSYQSIYQLLFDQYIDVDIWLKYSDLNQFEKDYIYNRIKMANDNVKQELQIHKSGNSLVMLRRMCLSMIIK